MVADHSDTDLDSSADGAGEPDGASVGPRIGRHAHDSGDDALSVDTVVVEERGRWAVDIVAVFPDGIVRKRIDTHPTKARAELSARLIKRAAERDLRGPLNG